MAKRYVLRQKMEKYLVNYLITLQVTYLHLQEQKHNMEN